jgi:hypothetical protein
MSTTASPSLRAGYDTDGFHIHDEPILSSDLLARAAAGLTDVRNGLSETGTAPFDTSWKPGDDPSGLAKIEMPQLANRALVDALVQSDLGRIAAEITGAEMVQVWWVQGLYKPPTAGTTSSTNIGWHQDHHYWQHTWGPDSELFTAWLALSDVGAESGPMQFVPGSHRWGEVDGDFFNQNQDAIKSGVAIPDGAEWTEVTDVLPAGGVSFHHRWLLHGSNQNMSRHPRLSLAVHLRTEKSAVLDPASDLVSYLDRQDVCPVIFGR